MQNTLEQNQHKYLESWPSNCFAAVLHHCMYVIDAKDILETTFLRYTL